MSDFDCSDYDFEANICDSIETSPELTENNSILIKDGVAGELLSKQEKKSIGDK